VTWELAQKLFIDPTLAGHWSGSTQCVHYTVDLPALPSLPKHDGFLHCFRGAFSDNRTNQRGVGLDYDIKKGRINSSTALLDYRLAHSQLGGRCLPAASRETSTDTQLFNQFRVLLGYGATNKRGMSAAANVGFDANQGFLQYASAQTTITGLLRV
jgi:hypothetical protein